jgi:zinc protease
MMLVKIHLATAALAAALATTGVLALVTPAAGSVPQEAQAPRARAAATTPKAEPAPCERGVERFRLANGLKVILRPIKNSEATALVVVYDIGEDHDPEGHSGLAHAIEHLYATAGAGEAPARRIDENAQTGERYTMIATVFPADLLDSELTDAAARMRGPKLTPADVDRERAQLLAEVSNMFEGAPALAAVNNARARVRPMPAGGRQGGRPEYLRAFTIEEIRRRLDRYYKPSNATLALAGDFSAAAARRAIESHFAAIPSGEQIPAALEPGAPSFFVPVRPEAGRVAAADGEPVACLAYRAPQPGSELYPPFLVLVARLWNAGPRLGGGGFTGSPVYFTPFDDGTVVAISVKIRQGEPPAKAFERIEAFVAEAIAPKLGAGEAAGLKQQEFGRIFDLAVVPDAMLDPYGVAFSIARRDQLGLDPAQLGRALEALTDEDLRRAARTVFDLGRHAGAIAGVGEGGP